MALVALAHKRSFVKKINRSCNLQWRFVFRSSFCYREWKRERENRNENKKKQFTNCQRIFNKGQMTNENRSLHNVGNIIYSVVFFEWPFFKQHNSKHCNAIFSDWLEHFLHIINFSVMSTWWMDYEISHFWVN